MVCVCVCVGVEGGEGEGVRVGFEQEGKERGAGKGVCRNLRFCETRNI